MNPKQLIRDLTYPMKSITPMKKAKVLQTFGNRKKISCQCRAKNTNEFKDYH